MLYCMIETSGDKDRVRNDTINAIWAERRQYKKSFFRQFLLSVTSSNCIVTWQRRLLISGIEVSILPHAIDFLLFTCTHPRFSLRGSDSSAFLHDIPFPIVDYQPRLCNRVLSHAPRVLSHVLFNFPSIIIYYHCVQACD